jgi:hypothetical protein
MSDLSSLADAENSATKKCPHCGQWTAWQQQPSDCCQWCGKVLEPYRVASNQARQTLADKAMPQMLLVDIKPDDGTALRFLKRIIRGGQLAFAALVAFFVWILTVVVG